MPVSALVSCLMVTLPSARRVAYAKQSIAAYMAQTYHCKELVIVQDEGDPAAKADLQSHVAGLARDDIRLVEAAPGLSLGALRNLSRTQATGTFLCQWDDDDLHHPERVEQQLAALQASNMMAVGLEQVLQFFPMRRELYWTNWRNTPTTVLPGTIMFRAQAPFSYPETGPAAQRGEDSDVCHKLLALKALGRLDSAPQLSIYVNHGVNTWGNDHHAMLANTLGISHGLLRRRETWLRERLADIDFGPGAIAVRGPKGIAFTLDR